MLPSVCSVIDHRTGQIMPADKYLSKFSCQMEVIVYVSSWYIISNKNHSKFETNLTYIGAIITPRSCKLISVVMVVWVAAGYQELISKRRPMSITGLCTSRQAH